MSKGYWQIPIAEEDGEKTAFVTSDGLYQFSVMPFGMVNAPAVFSRMMRRLLSGLRNVVNYIYDILIYSSEWDEHVELLWELMSRLRTAGLTARPTKCYVYRV